MILIELGMYLRYLEYNLTKTTPKNQSDRSICENTSLFWSL